MRTDSCSRYQKKEMIVPSVEHNDTGYSLFASMKFVKSLFVCFLLYSEGSARISRRCRDDQLCILGKRHCLKSHRTVNNVFSILGGSSKDLTEPTKRFMGSRMKGFVLLTFSIILEIFATCSMKFQANTKDNRWYLGVFGGYFLCFTIFPLALEHLPLGLAYATWCGIGMAATVYIANKYFGEDISPMKAVCLVLIGIGIIGLNIVSS